MKRRFTVVEQGGMSWPINGRNSLHSYDISGHKLMLTTIHLGIVQNQNLETVITQKEKEKHMTYITRTNEKG